jgi:MFS family permease
MPTGHIRNYFEHYFAPHPSRRMRALFVSTAMLNFAAGAMALFEPLYLHSVGLTIPQVILFYAVLYALYFFLLPLGGRICRRHGYEHTILFSSPFLILWYVSLFAIPWNHAFIAVALVSLVLQKILYWPGYHANFVTGGASVEQAREVSNMTVIVGLATVLAPAVGGAVIVAFGYRTLLLAVSLLILISNIPLLRVPELYEPKPFNYRQAIARPFKKPNRRRALAFAGYGEELTALVIWPLFMVIVIRNIATLGIIVSVATLASIVATLYIGRLSDEDDRIAVLRSGTLYTAASWVIRTITAGSLGVFLMDSFYRVSKNMLGVPLVATVYDEARDGLTMETVVMYEMSLALGKVAAALISAYILWKFPMAWAAVFVVAACFSLLYALSPKRRS